MGGGYYSLQTINITTFDRSEFSKIHDFAPFGICQDSLKFFLTFFTKRLEKLDIKKIE